jgi:hypothetical protein
MQRNEAIYAVPAPPRGPAATGLPLSVIQSLRDTSWGGDTVEGPKMDELTARLEVLMRRYASACDQGDREGAQFAEQFYKELQLLVSQYGEEAVDAALDGEMSDGAWPSVSLH